MKTTLLIMAAGIGSRFGTGIKQLEPVDEGTLGSDRASSKGYIVRWVEAPSNKLLTTAFEASLESVTVTCRLSVDSKIAGIAMEHRNPKVSEGRHRGQGGRQQWDARVRPHIEKMKKLNLFGKFSKENIKIAD